MSTIGSPIETSLLQAAQAQQAASKARDKEKAATESGRRFADQVDLKVAGVETKEAVRPLPHTDSEENEQEHRSQADAPPMPEGEDEDRPHVDLTA